MVALALALATRPAVEPDAPPAPGSLVTVLSIGNSTYATKAHVISAEMKVRDIGAVVEPRMHYRTTNRRSPTGDGAAREVAQAASYWTGSKRLDDEGITWCRGWDERRVEALLAAYALQASGE